MSPTTAAEKEWARIKVQSLLSQILHHVAPRPSDVVIVGACCQCLHGGQPWESWECCIMTHNGVPVRGGGSSSVTRCNLPVDTTSKVS